MTPAIAAYRFVCSMLLGGVLGIVYGFLRPLGAKHRTLADLLFFPAAVWSWIYVCFGVSQGDIRSVYLLGLLGGGLLWEKTIGLWLRPVFSGIWKTFRKIWWLLLLPGKKILYFAKILFASAKKWVTIKCTKILKSGQKRRKESHGREKHPAQNCESGSSSFIQYP